MNKTAIICTACVSFAVMNIFAYLLLNVFGIIVTIFSVIFLAELIDRLD